MTTFSDVSIVPVDESAGKWLTFFDRTKALAAVADHVRALPSSRTDEQHTRRVYEAGLKYFWAWAGDELPTRELIGAYVAELVQKGLKSTTISSKYLAPLRHYLKALAGQHIKGLRGDVRDMVSEWRDQITAAANVKTPKAEVTTNVAPLWRGDFVRLDKTQVNAVLRSIGRDSLAGQRDYALLHIAFTSALRLAELARITPASFRQEGETWLVSVRGKRNNIDPVPVPERAVRDVLKWVAAWNARVGVGDPRYIGADTPIWQAILHGDHPAQEGVNGYKAARGMTHQSLRNVIARRTGEALGERFALAAHDTRRTAAAIAFRAGMPINGIQKMLRHKDAAVTLKYIGEEPDYQKYNLGSYVSFG